MAARLFIAVLVALCASSVTSAVPTAVQKLDCSGSSTATWPHASVEHGSSTGSLECNTDGLRITVQSPCTATRVSIQALDPATLDPIEPFDAVNNPSGTLCSTRKTGLYDAAIGCARVPVFPLNPGGDGETPEGNAPVRDPFEDYLDLMAANEKNTRMAGRRTDVKLVDTSLAVSHSDSCGGGFDIAESAHQQWFLVEEHLYVDGIVQLVSRTLLFVQCGVTINPPTPDTVTPTVKVEKAEVCRDTTYSIDDPITVDEANQKYDVVVRAVSFPTVGNVGFYVDKLIYSQDEIVSNGAVNNVGSAIDTKVSPGVCSGTRRYAFNTDIVAAKPNDNVAVSAKVAFCNRAVQASCDTSLAG